MRDDDDDALAGLDLAAWQPPAPPADLADAVIVRLREPVAAAAVEQLASSSRRGWWIAGALAALAAGAALMTWGLTRNPESSQGDAIATNASHLALDGTTADLDAGAALHWRRDGHHVTVDQSRGISRWTVSRDDTLSLRMGGPGATETIVASGASLRVEVQMNLSDVRLVGVSGITAAAVAVATVAIYSGHVKATSGGQTVQIEPGATVELRPGQPPLPPNATRDPTLVGGAPELQSAQQRALAAEEEALAARKRVDELTALLEARRVAQASAAPATAVANVPPNVLESLRLSGEKDVVPDAATKGAIAASGKSRIIGTFKLCIDVAGSVSSAVVMRPTGFAAYDETIVAGMRSWTYRPYVVEGTATPACTAITFIYSQASTVPAAPPAAPTCDSLDADVVVEQAKNQFSAGFASSALALMKRALGCKQSVTWYRLAATIACAAHDAAAANEYAAKLPRQYTPGVEQKCQSEGITLKHPQ